MLGELGGRSLKRLEMRVEKKTGGRGKEGKKAQTDQFFRHAKTSDVYKGGREGSSRGENVLPPRDSCKTRARQPRGGRKKEEGEDAHLGTGAYAGKLLKTV